MYPHKAYVLTRQEAGTTIFVVPKTLNECTKHCDIAGFRAGIFFSSLNLECSQKGVVYLPNAKTKYFYNLDYSSLLVAIQSIEIQMY